MEAASARLCVSADLCIGCLPLIPADRGSNPGPCRATSFGRQERSLPMLLSAEKKRPCRKAGYARARKNKFSKNSKGRELEPPEPKQPQEVTGGPRSQACASSNSKKTSMAPHKKALKRVKMPAASSRPA